MTQATAPAPKQPARRACCARCLRPATACLCQWVAPVVTQVELLILQHPLEVANAKGSARLLHLCLPHSRIVAGERFDRADLERLLRADGRTPVLLYPDTPDHAALGLPHPPPLEPGIAGALDNLRLVVLDGTWRKSRKMLYVNPALQALPRYALRAMPPSHYRVRKAHGPDQLSTLEAACYALAQLEGAECCAPVLQAFDCFVDMLLQHQLTGREEGSEQRLK